MQSPGGQSPGVQSVAELIYGVPAPSSGKDPSSELSGWTMTFPIAFVAIPLGAVPNTTDLPSVPTYPIYRVCPLISCFISPFMFLPYAVRNCCVEKKNGENIAYSVMQSRCILPLEIILH